MAACAVWTASQAFVVNVPVFYNTYLPTYLA
jgi:hypothetical protein